MEAIVIISASVKSDYVKITAIMLLIGGFVVKQSKHSPLEIKYVGEKHSYLLLIM